MSKKKLARRHRRLHSETLEPRYLLHGGAPDLPFDNGLVLRLSGNHVTEISGRITDWPDLSSRGNDVTSTGFGDTPRVMHGVLNGNDAVRFDGINDALGRTTFAGLPTGSDDRTVIVLASYEQPGWAFGYGTAGSNQATGLGLGCKANYCGHLATFGWGNDNDLVPRNVADGVGWLTQAMVTTGGTRTLYRNGDAVLSDSHLLNTAAGGEIRVGTRMDGAERTAVDVGEILVFDRALDTTELAQLDTYFRSNYFDTLKQSVINVNQGVGLEFLPDGRLLAVQKTGRIFVTDPSDVPAVRTEYLDIPNVESDGERGLLDVTLDADFANNGHLYVYYSNATTNRFQISRFTHLGNTADLASEVMIWQAPENWAGVFHYGGSLNVGNDGTLYLTTGDESLAAESQELDSYRGKVLRINTDGTIPADNPFADGPGGNLDEIFAYGLRNPFRANYDEVTDRLYVGEVGGNEQLESWEDIHVSTAGANHGWPNCEGICGLPGTSDPIFTYPHEGTGAAVIMGDVYRGGNFPSQFEGAILYADYVRGWVRYLTTDASGNITGDYPFASDAGVIVDLAQGPDGAVYFVDLFGGVQRYVYAPTTQLPTITQASADVTNGAAPLSVAFTGSATTGGMTPMQYRWVFGDGNESNDPNPTHVYTSNGSYEAQLFVTNEFGTAASEIIEVSVGVAPSATILTPTHGDLFVAGATINYSATASDPDGTLTDSSYSWQIELIHNEHTHPEFEDIVGPTGQFQVPISGHDFRDETGFRLTLTVTDTDGLTATDVVEVYPDKVDITFDTVPSGIPVIIDDIPYTSPFTLDTLVGFQHQVTVASNDCDFGTSYQFDGWSNGATRSHVYTVPSNDATLTATFVAEGNCGLPVTDGLVLHLDADSGVAASGSNVVTWSDQSGAANDVSFLGGAPLFVSNGLNGQSYLRFDGIDDGLGLDSPTGLPSGAADRTMFVVTNYLAGPWAGVAYGTPMDNEAFGLVTASGSSGFMTVQGWGLANDFRSGTPGIGEGWLTQSAVYAGGELSHYRDGQLIDSATHTFNTGNTSLRLGVELNDNRHAQMELAEVIIFDRALNEVERQQVEDFLASQYFADNALPVANADSYTGDQGGTIDTAAATLPTVLANDSDADLDPLTAQLVTGPSHGSVSLNPDGSFVYTHDGSQQLSDQFTYRAFDGVGFSNTASVDITLNPTNTAPVALPDSYTVTVGGTLDTLAAGLPSLLDNDSDPQGDPLEAVLVTSPTAGTLQLDASTGHLIYTHEGASSTTDSFTYLVDDGQFQSDSVTVTLIVGAPPTDLPVTDGLVFHLDADSGVGTDANGVATWEDQSGQENHLFPAGTSPAFVPNQLNGNAIVRFDGESDGLGRDGFAGLPTGSDDRTVFLVADYLAGSWAGFSYGTPSLNGAFGLIVAGGSNQPLTIQGWGNANDQKSTTPGVGAGWLTQSVVYQDGGTSHYKDGALIDADPHVFATGSSVIRLGTELDDNRHVQMDVAEVIVFDRALSESERLAMESYLTQEYFSSTNAAPVSSPDQYAVGQGGTLDTAQSGRPNILANDTDANGDALTVELVAPPQYGNLTLLADGSFVYAHNGIHDQADQFLYRAFDGQSYSEPTTVTINVLPIDGPVERVVRWHGDYFQHLWDSAFPGGSDPAVRENRWLRGGPPRGQQFSAQDLDLDADGQLDDSRVYFDFSLEQEFNPPDTTTKPNGLIYHTEMPSARFYGGMSVDFFNYETTRVQQAFIENDGAGGDVADVGYPSPYLGPDYQGLRDYIDLVRNPDGRYRKTHVGPHEDFAINIYRPDVPHPIDPADDPSDNLVSFAAAFVWKKADFLNGGSAATVSVNADSVFSFESTRWWEGIEEARWIVQEADGTLYISEFSVAGQMDPWGATHSFQNPLSSQWSVYQPAVDDVRFDAASATWLDPVTAGLFQDVQAFGLYVGKSTPTGELTRFSLDEIIFDATVSADDPEPPQALADAYTVLRGETLDTQAAGLAGILANDTDANGDSLTAELLTSPQHGTLSLNADGSFVYVHGGSRAATDSFTYLASDGQLNSAATTVTLTIENQLPDFEGLVLHLDASQGVVTSGTEVVSWNDLSGNGNDLIPTEEAPQLVANGWQGNDVVAFDGLNDGLGRSNFSGLPVGAADRTVIMMAEYTSGAWGGFSYGTAMPNEAFGLIVSGGLKGRLTVQGWGLSNDYRSRTRGMGTGWLAQSVVHDAGVNHHFRNGNAIDVDTHTYATGNGQVRLGVELDDNRHMQMSVAEVLIYNRALSENELELVHEYLAARYTFPAWPPGGGGVNTRELEGVADFGEPALEPNHDVAWKSHGHRASFTDDASFGELAPYVSSEVSWPRTQPIPGRSASVAIDRLWEGYADEEEAATHWNTDL